MSGAAVAYLAARHDWTWQSLAACRGMDTAIFYHPENERGPTRHRREWEAKRICQACPVVGPCLSWALGDPRTVRRLGRHVRRGAAGVAVRAAPGLTAARSMPGGVERAAGPGR